MTESMYEGHEMRTLTEEEQLKLSADTTTVSAFKQDKLEKEAQKSWDLFYKRNKTNFFKDRHWTTREFEELCKRETSDDPLSVLEVGCGVGNFLFPLIEKNENIQFYACDFSTRAVEFVKENELYTKAQCYAFQCDLTSDCLQQNMADNDQFPCAFNAANDGTKNGIVDIVTMIFVLSAIHPDKMVAALNNIYKVLKPGGCVLFRDYGLYDHAMLRFAKGHKLSDNFYVRQDNTRAYYFSLEKLSSIFTEAGFSVERNNYIERATDNHKEDIHVKRIFVQAKFVKPYGTTL